MLLYSKSIVKVSNKINECNNYYTNINYNKLETISFDLLLNYCGNKS